jgi:cytosine/adenosine deaminase-related metal-dependent hydrolase
MASFLFPVHFLLFHLFLHCATCAAQDSILFQGAAAVISFNSTTETVQVLYNTSVLVTGDTVAAIFPVSEEVPLPKNTTIIPADGKIVTPGFVDTHRHLWQTAYKTLGSNTTLADYFARYSEFSLAKTTFTPDDVYLSQLFGIHESLNAGVTSIVDHAHHTWSSETAQAGLQASVDSGARVWWCYAFHDVSNATWTSPYTRQDQVDDFVYLSQHGSWRNSTVSLGIAYDNFGTENATLVNQIISLAR